VPVPGVGVFCGGEGAVGPAAPHQSMDLAA